MTEFWSFLLMKTLPADSLSGLNFTVFGLGDSSYKKYNYMGRMLHQRLQQLGAKSFLERGLGDDQAEGGYNLGLIKWKRDFFGRLKQLTGNSGPENECFSSLKLVPKPIYSLHIDSGSQYHSKDAQITQHNISNALGTVNKRSVSCGKLLLNNRCTAADHFQDVREIAFTKPPTSSFSPGDTCMIYPRNTVEDTQKMLDHCELLPSNIITLSDFEGKVVMQLPAEHLFGQLLDFSSPPKFFFFKMLAFFTEVEIYKEKINEMGNQLVSLRIRRLLSVCDQREKNPSRDIV